MFLILPHRALPGVSVAAVMRPRRRRPQPRGILAVVLACVLLLPAGMSLAATSPGEPGPSQAASTTEARRAPGPPPYTTPGDDRPNIVLISSDDQRLDEMPSLPKTMALIGDEGLTYTEAITPHPLCCPARAELLTGQYAQNNGVRTNSGPQGGYGAFDPSQTIATWLNSAGYNTAFLGKYLNGYGAKDDRDPGWTIFDVNLDGIADYYDFRQYVGDETGTALARHRGYFTDYVSDRSVTYAERLHDWDAPFFLWVSHYAPHPSRKAPGCEDLGTCHQGPPPLSPTYQAQADSTGVLPNAAQAAALEEAIASRPSYNEARISDKQHLLRQKGKKPRSLLNTYTSYRAGALASLDDGVGRLLEQLEADGELDNTYVVFITDNGYLLGEHRFWGKVLPFEEALRTPMMVRGPGVRGGLRTSLASSIIDLVPTFLDIAGTQATLTVDGRSMLELWRGRQVAPLHPSGMLIQAGPLRSETGPRGWYYRGIRTDRYTYVLYTDGWVELYDRQLDPYQVRSVSDDPDYDVIEAELARRTAILSTCAGDDCNQDFGPLPEPTTA